MHSQHCIVVAFFPDAKVYHTSVNCSGGHHSLFDGDDDVANTNLQLAHVRSVKACPPARDNANTKGKNVPEVYLFM